MKQKIRFSMGYWWLTIKIWRGPKNLGIINGVNSWLRQCWQFWRLLHRKCICCCERDQVLQNVEWYSSRQLYSRTRKIYRCPASVNWRMVEKSLTERLHGESTPSPRLIQSTTTSGCRKPFKFVLFIYLTMHGRQAWKIEIKNALQTQDVLFY